MLTHCDKWLATELSILVNLVPLSLSLTSIDNKQRLEREDRKRL
jgi:hypothetical protein